MRITGSEKNKTRRRINTELRGLLVKTWLDWRNETKSRGFVAVLSVLSVSLQTSCVVLFFLLFSFLLPVYRPLTDICENWVIFGLRK